MKKISVVILCCLILCGVAVTAQLRLPAVISSNMVLQQQDSVALWGWASPSEKIAVTPSWGTKTDTVVTDNGARWRLKIKTPAAGGPFTIKIAGSSTILLENVMVGEVWICSGQSNMELSTRNGEKDMLTELDSCAGNNLHFFQVTRTTSGYPQDDLPGKWRSCDSNVLKSFSAVGYFFGKRLNQALHVPIGLINSSWGGTPAETWTPDTLVSGNEELKVAAAQAKPSKYWPDKPGYAYNAMIAPLTNYSIAGAIWYQGESNTGTNRTYTKLFTTMIDGWRSAWKKEFPFYYVQIAPYKYGSKNIGALLQEAQTRAMSHSRVGMVVITDLIDSVTNIHPSHKREVGNRLAGWALAENYKVNGPEYISPVFSGAAARKGALVLSFTHTGGSLQARGGAVRGFYVSGADQQWVPATAKIEKDKIIVSSKQVPEPVYVRFGFSNTETGNVFSAGGLPLTPFRSDNWLVDESADK